MILYVKPQNLRITIGYRALAEKMWFKEVEGKKLEISHFGNDESLKEFYPLSLKLDKWLNDVRWEKVDNDLDTEDIRMEFLEDNNVFRFETSHIDVLTVDKRALYIMAIEIADEVQGTISEDETETWLSVDEFKLKHDTILNLSYDEANEISLKEAETMEAIDEPWDWQEDVEE